MTQIEAHDDILKARQLYLKLNECTSPQHFKKVFSSSIQEHPLDEFYPVIVRAELSAAIIRTERLRTESPFTFDFHDFLSSFFGLKPAHFINLSTQTVADITDKDIATVENIFRSFDYTVENNIVIDHPDVSKKSPKAVTLPRQGEAA